ncbi:MAG: hypothetical protein E7373_06045 [Clostridiales bacterium]|nr:hypothetical protein [Clostridiales bacterium]
MNSLLLTSFGEIISYVGYIALAVLVLLVMITVHELGHYLSGKILGFGIEEFAIGFGPKLFSKKKKDGEIFSVRLLPIGGFCAFKGEDADSDDPTAFNNKKPWQRIIVLISGAFMNYVLALLIIVTMFGVYGQSALMTYAVEDPTPIYTAEQSFQNRDVIIKANGENIYLTTDLMGAIKDKEQGELIPFTVRRAGKDVEIIIKLRSDTKFANLEDNVRLAKSLGIKYTTDEQGNLTAMGFATTGLKLGFFRTIAMSFEYSFKLALSIFMVLGQLITGALGISSIGGTVTTISVTATAVKVGGIRNLLNIASFIGVNLAVFNLLPIPALDGCRVVFTAIEGIRKKPISRRVEGLIHTVGFALILMFAIFIDLQQCF